MNLKVPLFRQKKGSLDCGIVAIQMVMAYFGIKKKFKELQKIIEADEIGTYAPQLGSYLQQNDFQTEIITERLTPQGTDGKLKTANTSKQDKKILKFFKEYLKQGGILNTKRPQIKHIRNSIKQNQPLIVLLSSKSLGLDKPDSDFHFNVITGIDDKYIYVNDPLPRKGGGEKIYEIDNYMLKIHSSAYGDLDNGSLLIIKRQ